MRPLRIDFYLKDRMAAPSVPIHLDALLAFIVVKIKLNPDEAADVQHIRWLSEQLPLERHECDGDWFFKASMLGPNGKQIHSNEFYTQRMDQALLAKNIANEMVSMGRRKLAELDPHGGKIDVVRGVHRNMLGFYGVTGTDCLSAFCIGDAESIIDLFNTGYVTHLGPRRRSGYGEIRAIEVVEDNDAIVRCYDRNRHIKMSDSDIPAVRPMRAPYWDNQHQRSVFVPAHIS